MPARSCFGAMSATATMAALSIPLMVSAATTTASIQIQATVISDCSIHSAYGVNFGEIAVTANGTDAQGVINMACTKGTAYTIALNAGTGTGSTIENRRLSSGSETVGYQLYRDSARSLVWGETPGTDTLGQTATGGIEQHPVYGRMPGQLLPAPGTYQSTVTVTITY